MSISDDCRADEDENAGADNGANAEPGQVPGREAPFEAMFGGVGISEDLLDGFGAKQWIAHPVSSLRVTTTACVPVW